LEDLLHEIYEILTIGEELKSNENSFQLSIVHRLSFSLLNLDPNEHELDWNFEDLNQRKYFKLLKNIISLYSTFFKKDSNSFKF